MCHWNRSIASVILSASTINHKEYLQESSFIPLTTTEESEWLSMPSPSENVKRKSIMMQMKTNGKESYHTTSTVVESGRKNQNTSEALAMSHGMLNTSDTVYTVPDIARMLGRKECTIRKRIEKGLIPAHKMGRCWYILKSEFVAELRDT